MSCLDATQVARAATLGESDAHANECLDCRRRIAADRTLRDSLLALPATSMTSIQRRALGAEILASAAFLPRRRPRWPIALAGVLAAAAAALLLARPATVAATTIAAPAPPSNEAIAMHTMAVAYAEPAPQLASPVIESDGATVAHEFGEARDVLTLVDGSLSVDTRSARAVDVRVGGTRIRVENASVTVVAHARTVTSVHVVLGAARIESGAQHVTLQRGSLWVPGPSASQQAMATFRDGWIALRAGKYREAIELFDRVTDPVAVEDAMFWAAIAARRSGDMKLADERIARFLEKFPHSAYAEQIAR